VTTDEGLPPDEAEAKRAAEVAARRAARREALEAERVARRADLQALRAQRRSELHARWDEQRAARAAQGAAAAPAEGQGEVTGRAVRREPTNGAEAEAGPALVGRNLTVRFRPFSERSPSLRSHGLRAVKRHEAPVVAVDDVSVTINRGEAFGFIGSNGAGKTTLLRVLAGVLPPDSGEVLVYGTQAPALLSLGAGMNRKLSGRRNVYLGGLAAGLEKKEIDEMFDDVVAYSELGDAIDRPASTYSTGMFARLAFAVAIRRRPQILLLDEVFAVGDQAFKKKSTETMEELLAEAGTIVMVSHGLNRMKLFCHRLAWMERGRLMAVGDPEEIAAAYLASVGITNEEAGED